PGDQPGGKHHRLESQRRSRGAAGRTDEGRTGEDPRAGPERRMTPTSSPGSIIVLTAPSGAGKTTIAQALLAEVPGLHFSVSATTRPPRAYEQDGVHYHFVSEARFRQLIGEDQLLEYEEVYPGRFYGTPRAEV